MSVAMHLGVADVDGVLMRRAVRAWPRWRHAAPDLAIADDLIDVPVALRSATPVQRDATSAALAGIGKRAADAIVALTWLLVPGASQVARRLGDLAADVDRLVAGQLWISASTYDAERPRHVAAAILNDTRREVLADLGVGDAARRRDRAWASVVLVGDRVDDPARFDHDISPTGELADLLCDAVSQGVISRADCDLLLDLASAADRLQAPARRGRAGLTSSAVIHEVSQRHEGSPRTIERRAVNAIKELKALSGL